MCIFVAECSPGSSSPRYQMLVMNPGFMPYTVRVIRCKSNNKSYRFKDLQGIVLYIFVNFFRIRFSDFVDDTISGKCLAAFLMVTH